MIHKLIMMTAVTGLVLAGCGEKPDVKEDPKPAPKETVAPKATVKAAPVAPAFDFKHAVPDAVEHTSSSGHKSFRMNLPDLQERKMSDFNPELAKFVGITKADNFQSARAKLKTFLAAQEQAPGLGYSTSMGTGTGGELILMGSNERMKDDSVRAYDIVARFDGKTQKFIDIGARIKCWRGPNAGEWTTELCP